LETLFDEYDRTSIANSDIAPLLDVSMSHDWGRCSASGLSRRDNTGSSWPSDIDP
jgi:hypothetical protein